MHLRGSPTPVLSVLSTPLSEGCGSLKSHVLKLDPQCTLRGYRYPHLLARVQECLLTLSLSEVTVRRWHYEPERGPSPNTGPPAPFRASSLQAMSGTFLVIIRSRILTQQPEGIKMWPADRAGLCLSMGTPAYHVNHRNKQNFQPRGCDTISDIHHED